MLHVPADCKGQESYFCSGIEDCRLTVERDIEGFYDNSYLPHPQKSSTLDRKSSKRTLRNYDKDAGVQLSTVDGFWNGCGQERTRCSFRGYWELDHVPVSIWTT